MAYDMTAFLTTDTFTLEKPYVDTSFKYPVNTRTSIDTSYMSGMSDAYKAKLEEMSQINLHYKEMATQKYAEEERLKEETFKKEKEERLKSMLEKNPEHAREMEKIRKVMGEEEWIKNNSHICNDCSREAGSSLTCRCTWKCKRHSGIPADSVARG
jgi:hypothetical protein